MQNGSQAERLSIMPNRFHTSAEYLASYEGLKDGYYEYWVDGTAHLLFTRMEDESGWIRVATVDWNTQDHIDDDFVPNIKPSDDIINALRTDVHDFNVLAEAHQFKSPFNEWVRYPVQVTVHNTMERFSSVDQVSDIKHANRVSFNGNKVLDVYQHAHSRNIGFGTDQGDSYFAYGNENRMGFAQEFSGSGRGEVFVR